MTQTRRSDLVTEFLRKYGPALSSTVGEHLCAQGVSSANARKIIERTSATVYRLTKLKFAHNTRFLYLPEDFNTERFWSGLARAFEESESAYGNAVHSLIARGGTVPHSYFHIISGSPVRMKKQISSETVLQRLKEVGIVSIAHHPDLGECIDLRQDFLEWASLTRDRNFRGRLLAEEIVLDGLHQWLRSVGLASYYKVETRNSAKCPQFGQFQWDLTAPSYVHPLVRYDKDFKPQPGFVIADVLLGRDVTPIDLRYFLRKTALMRAQPTTSPFLSIFVADRYTPEGINVGRKSGLILATTESIFGREVARGLSELIRVLSNAAAAVVANPTVIQELFVKLDALKGSSLNLRGALFELIMTYLLSREHWSVQAVNQQVTDPQTGHYAEIDVLCTHARSQVLVAECKGYINNQVTEEEVKDWVTTRIPRIRNYLLSQDFFKNREMIFQIWTTSRFTQEAKIFLRRRSEATEKYSIEWKDRSDLNSFVSRLGENNIKQTLAQHYTRM